MKRLLTIVLLGIAALGGSGMAEAHPANRPMATWQGCTVHLDYKTMTRITARSCHWYGMPRAEHRPIGHWKATKWISPHVRYVVRYPIFSHPAPAPLVPVTAAIQGMGGAYTEPMLVTYYLATGSPMANGVYPSVGWAACGYDLALGTRVNVPGIGTLTCGDRIGYDPWHHIDVFGVPLGTGIRDVTVYP